MKCSLVEADSEMTIKGAASFVQIACTYGTETNEFARRSRATGRHDLADRRLGLQHMHMHAVDVYFNGIMFS
jgi:hypothetical protein